MSSTFVPVADFDGIWCEVCEERVPFRLDGPPFPVQDGKEWSDICCVRCAFVIATISKELPLEGTEP